jgi:hypothetical protein
MRQQHHVITLATASWPTSPGEIAALADAEHTAQVVDGEFRFRPIDERELDLLRKSGEFPMSYEELE